MTNIILIICILCVNFFGSDQKIQISNYQDQIKKTETLPKKVFSNLSNLDTNSKLKNPNNINDLQITANSIVLLDIDSNSYLYSKNPDQQHTIASITKLATSLAVLENYNLDDTVTVSYRAASVYGSKIHLNAGEKIKVKELIAGMLVASGNDAALAIADHYGEDNLLLAMNQLALELNLKNTHFADAAGLSVENRSTSRDLATLTKAALSHPFIAEAVKTRSYTMRSTNGSSEHLIHTTNRLLKNYSDIIGVKTGYTEEAGFCLISATKKNNHQFLLVLLGSQADDWRFDESRRILNFARTNTVW